MAKIFIDEMENFIKLSRVAAKKILRNSKRDFKRKQKIRIYFQESINFKAV